MEHFISVVIPNYNGSATIGSCLSALYGSDYENFEVVVVDDFSSDTSIDLVEEFPCRLIRLGERSGASRARNIGARNSRGEILLFLDSDCVVQRNTLALVNTTIEEHKDDRAVIGGTYTKIPHDDTFFSLFQSVFVNYFETKSGKHPDYIASHALAMRSHDFRESGGFKEKFLPILEDVEFSHRLKANGFTLVMNPKVLVRHIFNFSLGKSLRNAKKKSMYWIMYSMHNRDLFADSGTASVDLKINGATYALVFFTMLLSFIIGELIFLLLVPVLITTNLILNKGLLAAFYKTRGLVFAAKAMLYYMLLYPAPIWLGALEGALKYTVNQRTAVQVGDSIQAKPKECI